MRSGSELHARRVEVEARPANLPPDCRLGRRPLPGDPPKPRIGTETLEKGDRPKEELGRLTFPDTSVLDMKRLHREWVGLALTDGPKSEMLRDRVVYYAVDVS